MRPADARRLIDDNFTPARDYVEAPFQPLSI